ncbi:MAG: hypothetical protein HY293_02825 [Planctomycetes bacterium]|nr:hypothetical protein [Planctomycetota bacterium]
MTTILPLLAALLLGWKLPGELIRDLSDDSIEIRERASAELYRQGEELRPLLVESRDLATDLEVRARLDRILRRLEADERIRGFGGANRVGGFAASLRSDRFFGVGPFRLSVDVMNVDSRDLEFPGVGTWDLALPDQELRCRGAEARLSVKRFAGAPGLRRTTWRTGVEEVALPAFLRPGECARIEYVLEPRALPAGDYQAAVEIFGAEEDLRTNSVTLMIRK